MALYPIYYSFYNQAMTSNKRKLIIIKEEDDMVRKKQKILLIDKFQTEIDYLFYEWNSIHIVLESIKNAFTIKSNYTPEYLDEIDKELSIAYDDLKSQIRQLERRLKKMSHQMLQLQQSTTASIL